MYTVMWIEVKRATTSVFFHQFPSYVRRQNLSLKLEFTDSEKVDFKQVSGTLLSLPSPYWSNRYAPQHPDFCMDMGESEPRSL